MFDIAPKFLGITKHYHFPLLLLTYHSLFKVRNKRRERFNYDEVPGDNYPQTFISFTSLKYQK